ncbi:hypothetical protein [Clostridium estertheticum]|uniref:Uncharacterized protein n=2 Tax=Clostridium estertheticum TaxID=238834 RepID=A0A1J0GG20_9CLOT|nr:hypothetical protein [Clostridium estertheticum]APC39920.1 hypothetical protein A7L45_07465 [Clostridium estertheticum subsp. estertheticum]MBU3072585.1 hypothetical protein [Clostridium estertheticum]MBU3162678.1 hypothetical protein [Clostridium estertheticum]MBU3172432.1 hypothetical protein [Clostridium estertheticum]MBU3187773.1 hypothetical protein [Clostridium estertheticum]
MKKNQKRVSVFKLVHTCIKENEELYIKSELPEKDLVKLIKVLQTKAVSIEKTFDLCPSEMMNILLQYDGIRAFPNDKDLQELYNKNEEYFNFIKIDLYSVWKNGIVIDDKDLVDIKYINPNALQMINDYIKNEPKILSKQTS